MKRSEISLGSAVRVTYWSRAVVLTGPNINGKVVPLVGEGLVPPVGSQKVLGSFVGNVVTNNTDLLALRVSDGRIVAVVWGSIYSVSSA